MDNTLTTNDPVLRFDNQYDHTILQCFPDVLILFKIPETEAQFEEKEVIYSSSFFLHKYMAVLEN